MGKYTDKQNFEIAMKQYPEGGRDYKIDELIYDFPSIFCYKNNMVSVTLSCLCLL